MITLAELRARHAGLSQDRDRNMKQLAACQEREYGFRYVLGELEEMIELAEQREAAAAEAADELARLEAEAAAAEAEGLATERLLETFETFAEADRRAP